MLNSATANLLPNCETFRCESVEFRRIARFSDHKERKNALKKTLMIFLMFGCASCAGFFQQIATERVAEANPDCQSISVSSVIPGGGDGNLDSYNMNVCGERRQYAWIKHPVSGIYVVRNITLGRPYCEMMITSQNNRIMRIFYLRDMPGDECISSFISRGWRISSTRIAHNGDARNGWGEEILFVRASGSEQTPSESLNTSVDGVVNNRPIYFGP